ncbi:MAG: NAD(P)/FAD-dependent oxidoreductase [Chitinophagaceae bacterium]|nr:NAD(P)/FAD-dependent oxidoreductase [Chitinophagaceae bacterium]MBK8299019.1 NAD(P)/FAD-dependent oxidoreductase [Chitinophagaceae bacterium]MBK9659799.1 NAD(P)/FAD-dependent oxidoreductase [Chitinophagaceae bacterium]MBP6233555.1 NAD(P)/FAD-dependent oxidoreductase [Chitinophagaceae bacterium]MBP6417666.1 NAD(P)/FAD-dependent oxidoreductase [Chitinophagaceae bacterium]
MKVVIVGAGFGGLRLARKLNNKPGFDIILVDKFNYHQFQPLFYQVATAGLDASNISFPLRKVFHTSKNVRIRLAELKQVLPAENKIITDTEEINYDALVLATGADTNFFGNTQIAGHAFPMKSTVEALQLRYRLLQNFEKALTVTDSEELQQLMNIVVVGGGPTGVEVSGALAEMRKYVLPKDYPELDFSKMNIYLLEGAGKTLAAMSEKSSIQSQQYLEKLGVTVMTNALVKDYDGKNVLLNNGEQIVAGTMIWAAGIKGNVPDGVDKSLIARGNRITTDRYCRVAGYNNIYAIGDLAYMETPKYITGHPQVAPVAMQQADLLAGNLKLIERKSNPEQQYEFEYKDKGSMATVGRNLAVVDVPKPKLHFGGFLAWMIWMGLHLMLILGVKNRFFVFSNWLYNYITYDQNLRLIFKEFDKQEAK